MFQGKIIHLMVLNLKDLMHVFPHLTQGVTLPQLRNNVNLFSTELIKRPHSIVDPQGNSLKLTGVYNICSTYGIGSGKTVPLNLTTTFTVEFL